MQPIRHRLKFPSVYLLGALLGVATTSLAQTAPAADAPVKPIASAGEAGEKPEVVVLSPFEVNTSGDRGYYGSSTLSGTRLNSKLEDLASPISVVTKQQMLDTAALDINDIFKYEANTEGMSQFTDFTIDRSFYVENTTLNPQSANRIRGIGSANRAVNNFSVSSAVPLDTYNIDSIEISRGPNANIFGLGNAAGTVNVNQGRANFARDYSQVVLRGDSDGGWRTQLDANRSLIKDQLAIRIAAMHDDKGFVRKPAYELINRLNASLGYRSPKGGTTIRASYESYTNRFSRSNTTLPRDSITEWLANGKPIWDPTFGTTGGWKLLGSTGAYTAVTAANEGVSLPLGLNAGSTGFWARPSLYVERDGSTPFYSFNAVANSLITPAPSGTPAFRYMESGTVYRRSSDITKNPATPLILFQPLSITDQSIYDWTSVNILSPNFGRDQADIYMVEIEQAIFNNQRHHLNMQLGYYHELVDRYDHSVFSRSDSGVPFLTVDVNEKLIDGTANPYFLRPYMAASEPALKATDEDNTNFRGTVAYQLDFRRNTGWTKWLGNHNLALYGEQRELVSRNVTSRDLNTTDYSWSSANDRASYPLRGSNYRLYPRYYMGDAVTGASSVIDYAPASTFSFNGAPLNWFTSARTRVTEPATIQEIIQSGNSRAREIRTLGATWQGYFWDDRVIATVGWRKDKNRERSSRNLNSNPLSATQPGSTVDPATKLHNLSFLDEYTNPWEELGGTSRNLGIVIKVNKWLNLNYSQSNSFKPENLAYNVNTLLLPNPTGKSKDYGFTLKMLDDKLIARVTRYESSEKNSRNGSITSAAVTRTLRLLFDPSSSNALVNNTGTTFPNGSDPFDLEQMAAQWYLQTRSDAGTLATATAAEAQQYAVKTYLEPIGINQAFIDRVRTLGASAFTDVNTVNSSGVEVELNYNPSRYWTMKIAGAQQKAIDTELGNTVDDFMTSRLDALRAIVVPITNTTRVGGTPAGNGTGGQKWWLMGATSPTATGASTPSGFYVINVKSVIGLATANAGKPRQQTREYRLNFTTNYKLAGLFDKGWLNRTSLGGSLRWESRAGVGYYGAAPSTDPEYKGAMVEYDATRPIYDQARTYCDFFIKHELKLWNDKIRCSLQFNVNNVFEGGRLQAISYNPDGTAWNYRIVDPRQFILTARFDL